MIKIFLKHIARTISCILILIILTAVIVQLTVYKEKENISAQNLEFIIENDPMFFTAHRGVNASAPENSLPSFKKSIDLNYYAAECDIRLTADGRWVLNHDDTMFLHFWSIKNISESTYEDIKNLKYKNGANLKTYYKEKIPTLEEYLDLFINSSTRPQIEIKSPGIDNLESILDLLKNKGLNKKAIIISFDIEQLKIIRKFDKNIELWYLTEDINNDVLDKFSQLGKNKKLAIKLKTVADEKITDTMKSGIQIAAWTVDEIEDLERAYSLGIRYITTNIFSN